MNKENVSNIIVYRKQMIWKTYISTFCLIKSSWKKQTYKNLTVFLNRNILVFLIS